VGITAELSKLFSDNPNPNPNPNESLEEIFSDLPKLLDDTPEVTVEVILK